MNESIKRPSWFLYLTESLRASLDFWLFMGFALVYRYKNLNDNRPILVVPGFLGSDVSTFLLRWFLQKNGFKAVYGWELGRNLGRLECLPHLSEKVARLYEQYQQPVTLIGWSLGGVFVREIAKEKPQIVSQIITLGSPFANLDAPNHARPIYEFFNHNQHIDKALWEQIPQPAPVPTTALYSKQDGVVPWQACMEPNPSATHQNIEVRSSHLGLVVNRSVLNIILKRLLK